ncbi:MAG TPA: alpha/beta hydrolase [Chitinophagaceae bacterium]|nr:alpha/beta hydrolase [Chitinophagaceae bacterium]
MTQQFLLYQRSSICYYRFGSGPIPVYCFHGYGESGESFGFLEKFAGDRFTFYAPDLPFHGKTKWGEGLKFTPGDLGAIIAGIESDNGIGATIRPVLMGFSLGGRVALSLLELRPERTSKLVLLAPDGLKLDFWYWLSTQTRLGNKLFRYTMYKPAWFSLLLSMINRLGLVNASIFKFVRFYIGDAGVREALYCRWTALRELRPRRRRLQAAIRRWDIPVRIVYGKHDRIISARRGRKFTTRMESQARIYVINSGHELLREKHAAELLPALNE